jgi:hypothetical protein
MQSGVAEHSLAFHHHNCERHHNWAEPLSMRKTSLNVAYDSSSDEDSETDRTPELPLVKKRKLPTLSHSLTVPTPVDNPSLHQGRTRTIPYKEGQWATHVYVPVLLSRGTLLYKTVADLLCSAKARVSALHATSPVTDEILSTS